MDKRKHLGRWLGVIRRLHCGRNVVENGKQAVGCEEATHGVANEHDTDAGIRLWAGVASGLFHCEDFLEEPTSVQSVLCQLQ